MVVAIPSNSIKIPEISIEMLISFAVPFMGRARKAITAINEWL